MTTKQALNAMRKEIRYVSRYPSYIYNTDNVKYLKGLKFGLHILEQIEQKHIK